MTSGREPGDAEVCRLARGDRYMAIPLLYSSLTDC